jgi:hypothetical protein
VLSGGLPREVLRLARAVFTSTGDSRDPITLEQATAHVVAGEIRALEHRTMASTASLDTGALPGLLTMLGNARETIRVHQQPRPRHFPRPPGCCQRMLPVLRFTGTG